MNPLWTQVVIQSVLRHRKYKKGEEQTYTPLQKARAFRELRIKMADLAKDAFLISLGIASAAFGLESFLLPSNFIDGGVTGTSLLMTELTSVPLSIWLIAINLPFILLAYFTVSKEFALKTATAIITLALVLALGSRYFPVVTTDNLLVAIFGGFFLGAGIGLSVRGGAVIDGTEVLAIFLSRKFSVTIGDVIIAINVLIFSAAAYFLSIEAALYSMITYLSASKTLDFIVEGIEEYTGVTIISPHNNDIRHMIITELGRGVTTYKGKSGFGNHGHSRDVDILYTVITRLEISRLNVEIEKIDPNAFVVMSSVKDTKGGMIKKRPLKH